MTYIQYRYSLQEHSQTIKNIREAVSNITKRTGEECIVAIAMHLRGPDIRTGKINVTSQTYIIFKLQ